MIIAIRQYRTKNVEIGKVGDDLITGCKRYNQKGSRKTIVRSEKHKVKKTATQYREELSIASEKKKCVKVDREKKDT